MFGFVRKGYMGAVRSSSGVFKMNFPTSHGPSSPYPEPISNFTHVGAEKPFLLK
jgi:hypothetical protein